MTEATVAVALTPHPWINLTLCTACSRRPRDGAPGVADRALPEVAASSSRLQHAGRRPRSPGPQLRGLRWANTLSGTVFDAGSVGPAVDRAIRGPLRVADLRRPPRGIVLGGGGAPRDQHQHPVEEPPRPSTRRRHEPVRHLLHEGGAAPHAAVDVGAASLRLRAAEDSESHPRHFLSRRGPGPAAITLHAKGRTLRSFPVCATPGGASMNEWTAGV